MSSIETGPDVDPNLFFAWTLRLTAMLDKKTLLRMNLNVDHGRSMQPLMFCTTLFLWNQQCGPSRGNFGRLCSGYTQSLRSAGVLHSEK